MKTIDAELVIDFIQWLDYDKSCLFEEYSEATIETLRKSERICDNKIADLLESLGFTTMQELINYEVKGRR